jgi:adenylate cyclase
MGHLEAALTLLWARPADEKRATVELRCLLELGECAISVHGYAAPAVARAYERACEVATRTGDVPSHVLAESGLFMHHSLRAELATAQENVERLLELAEQEPLYAGTALGSLGTLLLSRGEVRAAYDSFLKADAAWEPWPEIAPDLRALLCGFRATCRLVLGHFREAHDGIAQMLDRVAALPFDPLLVAQSHSLACYFHAAAGNAADARRLAEVAMTTTETHGVPLYLAPKVVYGWATGDPASIRDEMARAAAARNVLGAPQYGALLADVLLRRGDVAAAAGAVESAIAAAEESGEKYYLAELHRLRGRCLMQFARNAQPRARRELANDAALALERAMSIAESQGARLWLLRAATDACGVATRSAAARSRLRSVLAQMDDGGDEEVLAGARAMLSDG